MWPTALANLGIDLKGKIAEGAEDGRAVGRLTDLGHGQALRQLFRPDADDGAGPADHWSTPCSRCSATGTRPGRPAPPGWRTSSRRAVPS